MTRPRVVAVLACCAALTAALNWFGSNYEPVDRILAQRYWGAGTPSSSYITAFATLRPWWKHYEPEAIRVTATGGIEKVVRIPRSDVQATGVFELPTRGVGYYAMLGVVTGLRSTFSRDLIYDFELLLVLQRVLLLLALALVPLAIWRAHREFRTPVALIAFTAAWLPVLWFRPNRRKFLPDGILDSSLANALAVLGVIALLVIARNASLSSRRRTVQLMLAGGFLGFCTLVRGEFLLVFAFALLWLLGQSFRRRGCWKGVALSCLVLVSVPLANGLLNKSVFGHFVPLRLQSGQNLYEPIGQYPNPYGIRYDDEWLKLYLAGHDLPYSGFETDRFLTAQYVSILRDNPSLLLSNFVKRLDYFAGELKLWLTVWTIFPILILSSLLAWRDERLLYVSIPLILALGYLLIFGWLNHLIRLVAPAHFLINIFFCATAMYLVTLLRTWNPRGAHRRGRFRTQNETSRRRFGHPRL